MSMPPSPSDRQPAPQTAVTDIEYVPEELPPSAETPLAPLPVSFFAALFGYWLLADRWGPHLAAGSRLRALASYLIHFIFIAGCGFIYYLLRRGDEIESLHDLRQTAASLVLTLMMEAQFGIAEQLAIILAPLNLLLGLFFLSLLVAPWAAQGDTFRSAWARTLKSMLWSMSVFSLVTALIVVGYWLTATMFDGDIRFQNDGDQFNNYSPGLSNDIAPEITGFALACLVFARAAWGGMRRYVGPAVGPGFEPRHPLCHTCAYPIVGLPMTGLCPECQSPVQNSLPRTPLYAHNELKQALSVSHPISYLRFSRHLVGKPEILKLLPVRNAQFGVRYWHVTYWLSVLIALGLAAVLALIPMKTEPMFAVGLFGVILLAMPILQILYVLIGVAIGWVTYRIRDLRLIVGVAGYASGHWWPYYLGVVFLTALLGITPIADFYLRVRGAHVDIRGMAIMGIVLATLIFLPAMVVRLRGGLRIARHSNIN